MLSVRELPSMSHTASPALLEPDEPGQGLLRQPLLPEQGRLTY